MNVLYWVIVTGGGCIVIPWFVSITIDWAKAHRRVRPWLDAFDGRITRNIRH